MTLSTQESYWQRLFSQFSKRTTGLIGSALVFCFCFVALIAPLLASGKPLFLLYHNTHYFPLFRYLLFPGYYTKAIDLFFNLFLITSLFGLVAYLICLWRSWKKSNSLMLVLFMQLLGSIWLITSPIKDPAYNQELPISRAEAIFKARESKDQDVILHTQSWDFELQFLNDYARLNLLIKEQQRQWQAKRLKPFENAYTNKRFQSWVDEQMRLRLKQLTTKGIGADKLPTIDELRKEVLKAAEASHSIPETLLPSLRELEESHEKSLVSRLKKEIETAQKVGNLHAVKVAQNRLQYLVDKQQWVEAELAHIRLEVLPFLRFFHWEEDAAGDQNLNQVVSSSELTRVNRKDMVAALIFGARISLVVGIVSVAIALLIGVPIGALAGYYGGKFDLVVCRLLEIWESMPLFFMLLMVVAILQSKSIFLFITIIGLFSWTSFSRYIRGESLKQRNLPYIEACKAIGYPDRRIIFMHLLPNAIPPLLTLLPFAIMAAITSEAALSFLGLGEEGACSWGVLMDEGRQAFPAESYLLWPPAILLTLLLIAIALVGDALRDAIDPKMHQA